MRDREAPGTQRSRFPPALLWCGFALFCTASPLFAATRFAVIVTGASGGPEYAAKYDGWRTTMAATLRDTLAYPPDNIFLLGEHAEGNVRRATRENVRLVMGDLRRRASNDDTVFVMLIGHGTSMDQEDARFNLVGPDLTVQEWASLLKPIAARVIFVNGASGSFPFLEALAAPNRVIVTANDSAQQQFETVFPGFFVGAFGPNGADLDKNGKVSIFEAFLYAAAGVRDHFETRGNLATERPLLDDTGDGIGREAEVPPRPGATAPPPPPQTAPPQPPAADGKLAQVTYLQPEVVVPPSANAEVAALLQQRGAVQARIEKLRIEKPNLPPERYEQELEELLLELARLDRLMKINRN